MFPINFSDIQSLFSAGVVDIEPARSNVDLHMSQNNTLRAEAFRWVMKGLCSQGTNINA